MSPAVENLASALLDGAIARGRGEAIALREAESTLTYAALRDRVARAAGALLELGMQPGERVAVLMPDCIDGACLLLGVVWAGGIAVPVSELSRGVELRAVLADCGAALAIVDPGLLATVEGIRGGLGALREVAVCGPTARSRNPSASGQLEPSQPPRDVAPRIAGAAPAAVARPAGAAFLLYSAGARAADEPGRRGVPHGHATPLVAAAGFARGVVELGHGDRVFSLGRLSTAYGLSTGLLFPLAAGAESVLLAGQAHSEAVFEVVSRARPTVLFGTPALYGQLSRDALLGGLERPLAGVRACVSAAETTPLKVIERSRDVLGAELVVGYGLTEALHFVLAGRAAARSGSCGRLVPGFEVRLVDEQGRAVGPDEIGTLEIRGGSVAPGYWCSATPAVDRDGWFRTPDRFLVDRDGNYYHCGRADQLFKVSGKWVSPAEVEHALLGHEAVWECAVVGADDEDGLIKPLAFVVPNIGHGPSAELAAALREHVKAELAPYKYPRWIEFVGELPKGPHGKVLRWKLRDRLKATQEQRRAETSSRPPG